MSIKSEIVKLTDVVWFQEGPGVRSKQYTEKGIKLLNVANLQNGKIDLTTSERYISEEDAYGKYKHFLVDEGDLIIASSGIKVEYFDKKMGFVKLDQLPLCMNTSTIRFKALNSDEINMQYFMHYLKSDDLKRQLEKQIVGSAQLNFGPSHLKKMTIPLPPIIEQKKIADELDRISILIEKRRVQIEKLDLLVKSKFIEMFGDPVINPMGWEVKKLQEIADTIRSGNTPKGGKNVYINKGILFFRSQNVWKNKLNLDDIAFIDNSIHNKMKNTSLRTNDILITKTGRFNTKNSSLGRAALFEGEDGSANINGHVYLVRLIQGISFKFVLHILISDSYTDLIRRVSVGGIDKRQINKEHLEDFPIVIPPIQLQNQFAEYVDKIEIIKSKMQNSLETLETLKKARMQKYFG